MGHIVRSAAIARAIRRLGEPRPTIIASPGFTHMVDRDDFDFHILAPSGNPGEFRAQILEAIHELSPRAFITDALPMGLMGELRDYLPDFKGKKILVSRLLRRDYRKEHKVDEFVRRNYDLVIRSEALPRSFPGHPHSVAVPPILALDPSEMVTRQEARRMLKVPDDRFLVMTVGTDSPDCVDAFFREIGDNRLFSKNPFLMLRFASPYGKPSPSSKHTRYCPLMKLLPGADLVIGYAGYHLFHECVAAGVPALLNPRPRLYDDQELRVLSSRGRVSIFRDRRELEEGVHRHILGAPKRRSPQNISTGGARKAAEIILEYL